MFRAGSRCAGLRKPVGTVEISGFGKPVEERFKPEDKKTAVLWNL
jgi:hypothetical protein